MRIALLFVVAGISLAEDAETRRQRYLNEILTILPPSYRNDTTRVSGGDRSFEDWQKRTGELPPDFEAMTSQAFLPDPLDGVKTKADWQARRKWIREQYEQWIIGKMPPPPGNTRGIVIDTRQEGTVEVRDIRLEFGPGHKGRLTIQLVLPRKGGGPYPVFLTNHPRRRPWIAPAVRRGYIGAIFNATDPIYGAPDDSDSLIELYPDYDFSGLARWAWAGMRVVDYLHTLPEVDKARIGIAGHSRNGKMALIAAALDDRIGAVVASSGNTGECDPWRYTTDPFANETIEQITGRFPGWFHPRLRFFAGREHKLPVDQNMLLSMVAPRGLLMTSAYSETQGNSFGTEQAYRSVEKVYRFTNAPDKLGLSLRPGEHPTTAEDIELYVDFFDSVFGRSKRPVTRTNMHPFQWEKWHKQATIPPVPSTDVRERIRWALGDEPSAVPFPARDTVAGRTMTNAGWLAMLYERPLKVDGVTSHAIGFGDDLTGDLYVPAKAQGKIPVVIWLHSYAYPTGYSRYGRSTIADLTSRGYAVFAFDQIGFGTRIHQATRFYERYPNWSLMGKMVADTRAAIDALTALKEMDARRVYLAGYSLGGKIALFTSALDDRVAGVIAASAFTPLRASKDSDGTEGVRHYSHLHGLMPRLGVNVSIDYDEVLEAIKAPVLLRAPVLDRYASAPGVRTAVENARKAGARIELREPLDFNRFTPAAQKELFAWLETAR
ncbi:MAG TPA: alpha/beta fold hydrolase [Bryobacteraceae bacterium]|nr:alpha/beta fold hydrolase [Bryobacteraceae bacterium]